MFWLSKSSVITAYEELKKLISDKFASLQKTAFENDKRAAEAIALITRQNKDMSEAIVVTVDQTEPIAKGQEEILAMLKQMNKDQEVSHENVLRLESLVESLPADILKALGAGTTEPGTGGGGGPEPVTEYRIGDRLGFNFTWSADKHIDEENTLPGSLVLHTRLFAMKEKDVGSDKPQSIDDLLAVQPAPFRENVWDNPKISMRENLDRVLKLRQMFKGLIILTPEAPNGGRGYPLKDFGPKYWESIGKAIAKKDHFNVGKKLGKHYFECALITYANLGVVIEFFNEPRHEDEVDFWAGWIYGAIEAHKANPTCQLAIGDLYLESVSGPGICAIDSDGPMHEAVMDALNYLDEIGGFAGTHPYPLLDSKDGPVFTPDFQESPMFRQAFTIAAYISGNFPNIIQYAGEFGYTSNTEGYTVEETVLEDYKLTEQGILSLLAVKDFVLIYQGYPAKWEALFGGTALLPHAEKPFTDFANTVQG